MSQQEQGDSSGELIAARPGQPQTARILVTVKAYPAISQRHGEVVCVAGIRLDSSPPIWIRLWPVEFRDLPFSQRFQKYQFISVAVDRSARDSRPESFRPVTETLVVGETIGTQRGWADRRRLVEPLIGDSMCAVQARERIDRTSLAIFRPSDVDGFVIETDDAEWDPKKRAVIAQPSLFAPDKDQLLKIPYKFKYRYRCAAKGCPGHEQSIIDWEIAQAYLKWAKYGSNERLRRLRSKWLGELCSSTRDFAFFVGNQHQHPTSFVVLGVFWPPKVEPSFKPEQLRLLED